MWVGARTCERNVSQSVERARWSLRDEVPLAARPRRAVLARCSLRRLRVAGWWLSMTGCSDEVWCFVGVVVRTT